MALRVLLASHGTPGARAAEGKAFELAAPGGSVHQVLVVPDFWKGMKGDDWLNNGITRDRFGSYVEEQLEREIAEEIDRVGRVAAERGIPYSHLIMQGQPADCLVEAARLDRYDMAVIGAPRPGKSPGLRSRLDLDKAARGLPFPLLIVPHPER